LIIPKGCPACFGRAIFLQAPGSETNRLMVEQDNGVIKTLENIFDD
jgi:hypothetical protein